MEDYTTIGLVVLLIALVIVLLMAGYFLSEMFGAKIVTVK